MGTLLELGRYALEGVEVMLAFGTTAVLAAGLLAARHAPGSEGTAPSEHLR
jgi:hypothetical protein